MKKTINYGIFIGIILLQGVFNLYLYDSSEYNYHSSKYNDLRISWLNKDVDDIKEDMRRHHG